MSKIYLHYDGERGPDHTFIWRQARGLPSTGRSLGEALQGFIDSYHRKHGRGAYDNGRGMDATMLRLVADGPDPLGTATAAAAPKIALDTTTSVAVDPSLVYPGCDIRVEERDPKDMPTVSSTGKVDQGQPAAAAAAATSRATPSAAPAAAPAAEGVTVAGAETKATGNASVKAKKLAIKAEKMMARKNLRGARSTVNEALELDPKNGRALRCLAEIYRKAGRLEEAFAAAKDACAKATDGGTPEDFLRAGRCLLDLERYEEARTALGRARTAGSGSLVDDADAALAFCRFKMGDAPGAGDMYMEVLRRTGEKHVPSLVGYGRLAMLFNQLDKGMPSLLRAVMFEQENKEAREVLARALGKPEGMQAMKEQVVPGPETTSVYTFLATVTKDHGQIDASVELLRVAATVDPSNASCALALVHGHEILGDNAAALSAAKSFFAKNPLGGIGSRGLRNSAVLGVLEGVPALSPSVSSSPPPFEDCGMAVRWATLDGVKPLSVSSASSRSSAAAGAAGGGGGNEEADISFAWCEVISDDTTPDADAAAAADGGPAAVAPPTGPPAAPAPAPAAAAAAADEMDVEDAKDEGRGAKEVYDHWLKSAGGGKEMYAAKDLDILALCFAVFKILYLEGQWLCLPQLLGLIEPARIRSLMPLHKTTIRNEQAYYCCITQLLSSWGSRSSSSSASASVSVAGEEKGEEAETKESGGGDTKGGGPTDVVYVCGDSHTLTPAWHEVTVGGRRRVLRPALVTGLKHWHLRPESNFYPKKNFESVMAKVPNKSTVVFILGEIDCREGILVAVDKLRYDTAEKGAEHTIGIFIKTAEKLSRERGLKIYVHPVIPVLNETRSMVKMYNRVFRRLVRKSKHLHWLDFFDQLLDDAGDNLRPDFRLDGTHLGPSYVDLLEKALGDAWVEGPAKHKKGESSSNK